MRRARAYDVAMRTGLWSGTSVALALVIVLTGCVSAPSGGSAGTSRAATGTSVSRDGAVLHALMRDLTPAGGAARFLGVAPRSFDRESEYDAAVLHVAEQASRYVRMAARYKLVTQRGSAAYGSLEDIEGQWDARLADELVARVQVVATEQDSDGTYVVATVDGVPPAPPVPALDIPRRGEPSWVSRPPTLPGYIVAVGLSLRSRRLRDSVDLADQEALTQVLLQAGATVRLVEDRREVEGAGVQRTVTAAEEASAVLRQFHVLSRWASDDGLYYYSLVIAREE